MGIVCTGGLNPGVGMVNVHSSLDGYDFDSGPSIHGFIMLWGICVDREPMVVLTRPVSVEHLFSRVSVRLGRTGDLKAWRVSNRT